MRPVILDTDIGSDVDDLLALVLLLRSETLDLRGVTTVYGDTVRRARIAAVTCGLCGRPDVPVVAGAQRTLSGRQVYWTGMEGEGVPGLDDAVLHREDGAEEFLLQQAEALAGELEILAIGPLTNLARAIDREPRFCRWVKRLYLMGGCFYDPRPEHNIRCDTRAAVTVFGSGLPITAFGLDVTTIPVIRESDVRLLERDAHPVSRLVTQQIRGWWMFRHADSNHPHDPLAALGMERPDLFRFEPCGGVRVETDGLDYGRTERVSGNGDITVASDVLSRTALAEIMARLGNDKGQSTKAK